MFHGDLNNLYELRETVALLLSLTINIGSRHAFFKFDNIKISPCLRGR